MTETAVGSVATIDCTIVGRSSESTRGRGIVGLPDRIVMIACTVFVVAAFCGTLRIMFWWSFVPLLALALFAVWRFMPQAMTNDRAHRRGTWAAIGIAIAWLGINIPFASQYLDAIRDPGIYMMAGAIMAHSGGSPIDVGAAQNLASAMPGLTADFGPFVANGGNEVRLQGSSGFPALLALGYWIGGVGGADIVNLVVGAVGLVALCGLGRRCLGPFWSLLPAGLVACAMPYIYLSRTSYTEVITALLIVASATWLISAFGTRRIAEFAVAGSLAGMAGLTRVDGSLAFTGALLGLILVMIGIGRSEVDHHLRWRVLAFAVGGWIFIAAGIVDLRVNHTQYLLALGSMPTELWGATALFTGILLVLAFTPLGRDPMQYKKASPVIARSVTITLAIAFVYWMSRPLWMVNHLISAPQYVHEIAVLQAQDGLPIDGTRSYDEYSLWWFGWYFGWVFLALAIVGMCVWVYWAISRRNAAHTVILATAAVVALLYIDFVNVAPDQIWAFRRVLPVLTPTLALAAAVTARWLWKRRNRWSRSLTIVGLIGCLAGVALPWGTIFFSVEGSDQAQEIERICAAVGDAKYIAMVGNDAPPNYALTLRAECNDQVVTIKDANAFDWAALDKKANGKVAVVTYDRGAVPWTSDPLKPIDTADVRMWTRHLLETPRTTSLVVRSVWVGRLQPDGRVAFTG
jgi:hypothetical protein